jgi:hypothetical protein
MIDLQSEVQRAVQGFVTQIVELVRHTAVETLQIAFAGPGPTASSADDGPGERGPDAAASTRPYGPRRTLADLRELSRRLAAFVHANPGLGITQINQGLGTRTRDLALPIRKLMAIGVIRAVGQKRSTRYFAILGPALDQELAPRPEADVHPRDPLPPPTGEPDAVRVGARAPREIDADWHRCLADVFTLAQRLEK